MSNVLLLELEKALVHQQLSKYHEKVLEQD